MRQKGFVLLPAIVIILLLGTLGYFIYQNTQLNKISVNNKPVITSPSLVNAVQVTITGVLTTIWNHETHYTINEDQGQKTELLIDEEVAKPLGGSLAINGKRITIKGELVKDSPKTVKVMSIQLATDLYIDISDRSCKVDEDCIMAMIKCSCDCGIPINKIYLNKYLNKQNEMCKSYTGPMCKMQCEQKLKCISNICTVAI